MTEDPQGDLAGWVKVGCIESRVLLKRIISGPRPGSTLAVWEAAILSAEPKPHREKWM